MKAYLEPLSGNKYYGTEVEIQLERRCYYIQIWINDDSGASEREIALLDEGDVFEISNDHYETKTSLEIARKLVEAINND